jgi:hypothetical protein
MKADTVDQTFLTYKLIYASLRLTKQIAESSDYTLQTLYKNLPLWGKKGAEFEPQMVSTITKFNDVMVLALFAAFERELRISIQNVLGANLQIQNQTVLCLAELTSESIERWSMIDMLFALRYSVDDGPQSGKAGL